MGRGKGQCKTATETTRVIGSSVGGTPSSVAVAATYVTPGGSIIAEVSDPSTITIGGAAVTSPVGEVKEATVSAMDSAESQSDGSRDPKAITLENTQYGYLRLTEDEIDGYTYYSYAPPKSQHRRADDSYAFMVKKGSEDEARLDRLIETGAADGPGDWRDQTVKLRRTTIKQALRLRRAGRSYRVWPPYTLEDTWKQMKQETDEDEGIFQKSLLAEHYAEPATQE